MRIAQRNNRHTRSGLTLIELLVVMGIIVVVAGIAVLLVPMVQSEKASRGAQDLQGSLMEAKYRSLRDKSPKGIRLNYDPADPSKIRSYQFIEQPGTWTAGSISGVPGATTATISVYTVTGGDVTAGLGADKTLWPVQAGDYLYVNKKVAGLITAVTAAGSITVTGDPLTATVPATPDWYVVRRTRPIPGEEVITFPDGVVVDRGSYYWGAPPYNTTFITNLPFDGNYLDIMFTPSGAVTGAAGNQGQIYLWVRDENRTQDNTKDPGEQIVIVIWTRTGKIGAYPLDTTTGQDPLSFTKDPKFRPSGL